VPQAGIEGSKVKFSDLGWAALLHYYQSGKDRKYVKLFGDTAFISKLRKTPWDVSYEEFEAKVISSFINSLGLRLPVGTRGGNILAEIIRLRRCTSRLQGVCLLDCDLSKGDLLKDIKEIYHGFSAIDGLWLTGISKIAHLLNDSLFVILDLRTADYFGLRGEADDYIKWLSTAQQHAQEATSDFEALGLPGSPEAFLSEKLGYSSYGCQKSLARFIDEYFWLTTSGNLPVPPKWVPPLPES
jgi:hypothetical protein